MFHRPVGLPSLHPRDMTDDGPYIGSNVHNDIVMWLFSLLRSIEEAGQVSWHVTGLLGMDIPWDDGRIDRFFADLTIYPTAVDPITETISLDVAGPPLLVPEIADVATAEEMAADIDLTDAKAALYEAIGVRDYLVYDLELARTGRNAPIWARKAGVSGGWEPWEPDERGPDGEPYQTRAECMDGVRSRAEEERAAVAEAKLTLLRARYKGDLS